MRPARACVPPGPGATGPPARRTGARVTPARVRWVLPLALLALGALPTACGGTSHAATPTYIAAGQVPRADLPLGGGHGSGKIPGVGATVPLAKQNPTTALFTAIGSFQSCLTELGVTFIGAPDPKNPSSGTNNPVYLKSLGACAAQSHIVQALKTEQDAQQNLTPAQVKAENKQYLIWRKCMIARGWGIPTPTPNAKGLLFSFGGSGGGSSQLKPPPGQSVLSSPDIQACAAKIQVGSS